MFAVRRAVRRRPAAVGLVAVAAVALALRLFALGERSAHWDEARVGYWTLRYAETGAFAYRPIIHGPFLPVVQRRLFELLGPSMATARLPAALAGAALPLAAWLFRDSLDDAETVALGALLAVDPLLLYYSRFARADVPLAAFAVLAVGFAARALATGRRRYLLASAVATGLALTTKENALVYLACWAGAAVVAAGVRAAWRVRVDSDPAFAPETASALRAALAGQNVRVRRLLPAVPVAVAVGVGVAAWFYAPRGAAGHPSLSAAFAAPALLPALAEVSTVGAWETFAGSLWAGEAAAGNPYLPYLAHYAATLAVASGPLYALAVAGAAVEHRSLGSGRGPRPPRALVTAAAAWGAASVVGYPLGTDIMAPWLGVHAVAPLAIPAAVGLVAALRLARARVGVGDRASAGAVCLALLALSGQVVAVGGVGYTTPPPRVNFLAQGAQPGDDLAPLAADIAAATRQGSGSGGGGGDGDAGVGVDVLYVGERFDLTDESVADTPPASGAETPWLGRWLRRLPVAWYAERVGARTASVESAALANRTSAPPVVIATPERAPRIAAALPGYRAVSYDLTLYGGTVVAFVDPAPNATESERERTEPDGADPNATVGVDVSVARDADSYPM